MCHLLQYYAFIDTSIFRFIFDLLMLALAPLIFAVKRKTKILNKPLQLLRITAIVLICLIINLTHFNFFCAGLSLADCRQPKSCLILMKSK